MGFLRSKNVLALVGALLVCAVLSATALSGVWSQWVAADGGTVHFRVIKTSASDFDSGWHIHPGPAIVQVTLGSFQITQGSCTPRTVNAGDTFIEVPYTPVRAVAVGRIEWTTTLIGRAEEPLLTPVASPCP
jgi:hypothetical protein